jgi:cardiolipin synthase
MAKHLAAAAGRGVPVKVIYDPMGSKESNGKKTSDDVYKFMQQHGVQVIAQQPTALADHLTHRKITVVDGQTAFTGGMNVGDEYSTLWHDVHSKVEGPAVADLQKLFIQQWKGDGGTVTPQEVTKMLPNLMPVAETSARVIGHEGRGDQNIKLAYLRAIDTAQTSVKIANPYFSDPDVMKSLANAAKRGVDVQVVVPATNDMAAEQNASRANYLDLVNAGVKVYEYAGAPMAHDKVATFDGKMSTIGSSNLDARSLGNNDEANVWTGDPSVAKDLEANLFARDIGQSTLITKQQAESFRTLTNRVYQNLSSNL